MPPRIDEEITFRKLEILLAFMAVGNLARAAEQLDITAASVHRALHSLEAALRCQLFRREGRNLHPTAAAQALAEVARQVLGAMADGVRRTRDIAGYAAQRIRIGSLYSLTSGTVPALIQGLKLRRPELQAELVLGSNSALLRQLREGSIDAALIGLPDDAPDLVAQVLFEDEILFAAPAGSRHAQQPQIDLAACADEHFVSLSDGFATYRRFMEAFAIAGYVPQVVMTTDDIFSLMNLVGGGIGCTLLPGRVRSALPAEVRLIPLQARFRMRQAVAMCVQQTRERDPNLLALLAVGRGCAGGAG